MAARKIHNQGRAVNVLLWQGTQDPTDQNLPKLVREGAHIRASLVLGTESQARMALGDKAVDGGAAPHLLRQAWTRAPSSSPPTASSIPAGQSSITVRTHYIDDDAAEAIADRAKALRDGVTTCTPSSAARSATRSPTSPPSSATRRACGPRTCCTRLADAERGRLRRLVVHRPQARPGRRRRRAVQVRRRHGRRPRPRRPRPRQPRRRRFRFRRRMTGSRPPTGQGGRENSLTASLARLPGPDLHK